MNRKILGVILFIGVIVLLILVIKNNKTDNIPNFVESNSEVKTLEKVKISASFYPLAEFSKQVGGDLVDVQTITPSGVEPHEYEPTSKDVAKLYSSDLVLLNGNGIDTWSDKLVDDLQSKDIAVLRIADGIDSLKGDVQQEEGFELDPHFWLNPINAQKEIDLIAEELIKIDPTHQEEYNKNRQVYKGKLVELDEKYKLGLSSCKLREIVTSHNAFNYLAHQYGLSTLYILGLSTDEEPSPKTIADVSTVAKQKGIKYIFFETLLSPKISEAIASEIGAQTLVLNPIEGLTQEDLNSNKNYLSIMYDNLENLRKALECQ